MQTYRPRLAFVGLGWIGLNRLQALAASSKIEVSAVVDTNLGAIEKGLRLAPDATAVSTVDDLQSDTVDGVVIATPNALHRDQTIAALDKGLAVFCQKPLGRSAAEVNEILTKARQRNRLVGVDLSYRYIPAMIKIRQLIERGDLGDIFAIDLTFHNAYGPDKSWFYDRQMSGGGCVIDLGVHLIDLALWSLGFPKMSLVSTSLFGKGQPLKDLSAVEDFAVAQFSTKDSVVRMTCSWNLHAGTDAVIAVNVHGTRGGAVLRNVSGSFYDFVAQHYRGRCAELLSDERDCNWNWAGLAALSWCEKLAHSNEFDPTIEHVATSAELIDQIYASVSAGGSKR
ncbi:MAG: Gfo/Idh/MocA family protein [Pyrinomonadaceae bacterium]